MPQIIRLSDERGHANHGWLNSRFSFSFAEYYDPKFMGYGPIRVINDDYIKGGGGFPMHPHANMEIVTYVIEGSLEHKDSLGNGSIIKAGDVQRMTAGTGIRHSEFNPSANETCHLLQIWILPDKENYTPSYEQIEVGQAAKKGKLCLIASNNGLNGSVTINQKLNLYASIFNDGDELNYEIADNHGVWLQIARGNLIINGKTFNEGDAVGIYGESALKIGGAGEGEFLLFDIG